MMAILAATAITAAEETKKSGLPQLNVGDFAPQLIWLAVSFIVLYVVLWRIALPRVADVLEERADRIQGDLDAAERLKAETERALAAYEQAFADAKARAHAISKEARDKLDAGVAEERGRIEKDIGARLTEAERRIAVTKTKALTHVAEIAAATAGAVVAKLLGVPASPEEIRVALVASPAE